MPLILLMVATTVLTLCFEAKPVKGYEITSERVFSSSSSDGMIYEVSTSYSTAHGSPTGTVYDTAISWDLGQYYYASYYWVYRGYVFFDTTTLPEDANITSAVLSLCLNYDGSTTDFNVTLQNGQPTYPHDPLLTGDYVYSHYSGNGGSRSTSTLPGIGNYWNITLNDTGISWIETDGTTKLCLRSQEDIDYSTPSGSEEVRIYSTEKGTGYTPKLYVSYTSQAGWLFRLYGAYDEDGLRDGAINVTFYRPSESNVQFELNGTYDTTMEGDTRAVFYFDLGYNESRVYYVKDRYEDIYVFKPEEPYYTYYFSVSDLVGLTDAYLETLINVNGTDRVVERWNLDIVKSDIPVSWAWGSAYKVRIVADEGTHEFGMFMAEATESFQLVVTHEMFPETETHIGEISIYLSRPTYDHIQVSYTDGDNQTTWLYIAIYEELQSTELASHNETSTPCNYTYDWYDAGRYQHYRVEVSISHAERGSLSWSYTLEGESEGAATENPWDLEWLGTLPFAVNQLVGLGLCLLVFGSFTQENAHVGMVVTVLVAMAFTAIGWLEIPWAWLVLTLAIAILAGLSMVRKRSESVI